MKRILVAGIGNIFLGDDAFGTAVAQRFSTASRTAGVEVHDFGIRCLDLAYMLLDNWDAAILVDAATRGGAPGTLYRIALDAEPDCDATAGPGFGSGAAPALDAHSITVNQVRHLAQRLGVQVPGRLPRLFLVGCEPASLEPTDGELSPPVAAAVPAALTMVGALIEELSASPPPEVIAA